MLFFFITSQCWVVLSIWDSSRSPFTKILRGPQNPVMSLIIAYPEASKSRIQDTLMLTRAEAAEHPTVTWDLAGAGSCLPALRKNTWALLVHVKERGVKHAQGPCKVMSPKSQCTLETQHRLLLTSFGSRYLCGVFQIHFSLPSSCLFAGSYGGEEITSQGSRRLLKWPFIYLYFQTPLLIKIYLMNSDISYLKIKGKQENVVLSGETQLSGLTGNLCHYPELFFVWNPLQRVHKEYFFLKSRHCTVCELNRNQVREVINDNSNKGILLVSLSHHLISDCNLFFHEQLPSQNQFQCKKDIS